MKKPEVVGQLFRKQITFAMQPVRKSGMVVPVYDSVDNDKKHGFVK